MKKNKIPVDEKCKKHLESAGFLHYQKCRPLVEFLLECHKNTLRKQHPFESLYNLLKWLEEDNND